MITSRCGLNCADCTYKTSHNCGGCIETAGRPFHGDCPIAVCCQNKGHAHCGECGVMPCKILYAYSYDAEHGDDPPGARLATCRRRAAESGKHAWKNVLLTDSGFEDDDGKQKRNTTDRFLKMLDKPVAEAKVLFIPTAAVFDEAIKMAGLCFTELVNIGIKPENITAYDVDGTLSPEQAMEYDVIYFTGGSPGHLLKRLKETGFDETVKKMVYAGKVYVGVSAGSLIATPRIGKDFNGENAGLCFANVLFSFHNPEGTASRTDLPLPHIALTGRQALAVSWAGYELIEEPI